MKCLCHIQTRNTLCRVLQQTGPEVYLCESSSKPDFPSFSILCWWNLAYSLSFFVRSMFKFLFFTFRGKVAEVLKMRFMHCEKHIWLCAIQNIHRSILFCTIINPLLILREAGWLHKKTCKILHEEKGWF